MVQVLWAWVQVLDGLLSVEEELDQLVEQHIRRFWWRRREGGLVAGVGDVTLGSSRSMSVESLPFEFLNSLQNRT